MADKFTLVATLPATGCTREDIYSLIRTAVPTVELVDNDTLGVTGGKVYAKSWVPRWSKFSFAFEDFTAAGLTEAITAFALAAGGVIHKVVLDVTEAWVVPGMGTLDLELGVAADADKYSGGTHQAGETIGAGIFAPETAALRDAFAALDGIDVTDGSGLFDGAAALAALAGLGGSYGLESMDASTNILLTATSDAGNLSTATAGAVDVYVLCSNLINT